jgi:urease accessory protein
MIRLQRRLPPDMISRATDATLTLPFDLRRRSRLLVRLDDGEEGGLFLERGTVLRDGDLLEADDGRIVRVIAAPERIDRVTAGSDCPLARAAYHLGNRHVPIELGADALKLECDPVLRAMLLGLGAHVAEDCAPFQPEPGAYGGGHRHGDPAGHAEEYGLAQAVYASRHGMGGRGSDGGRS